MTRKSISTNKKIITRLRRAAQKTVSVIILTGIALGATGCTNTTGSSQSNQTPKVNIEGNASNVAPPPPAWATEKTERSEKETASPAQTGSGGGDTSELAEVLQWGISEVLPESAKNIYEHATGAEPVQAENETAQEGSEYQEASLIRVVDGDTIIVNYDGEEYRVRLIGINTPESVAPESYGIENTAEGVLASDYTKDLLKNVSTVYLEKDTSETDQYDRLLRYVWLEIPEDKDDINEIATKMLNGILVLDNVAEPVRYEPDTYYAEAFEYIAKM